MHALFSYGALGALIGTLVGLSADSLVKTLIPLVFTFAGGTVLAVQDKLDADKIRIALYGFLGIGLGGLVGLYSALIVTEHRWLTPEKFRSNEIAALKKPSDGKYLRADQMNTIDAIAQRLRVGTIEPKEAAAQLKGATDETGR